MFLHLPVNHPTRPAHRFLGGLTGLYVLLFGIVGLVASRGHGFFARGDITALGLHTNVAFALVSILVGLVVVAAALVGRNVAHYLFVVGGLAFLLVGMAMLVVMQTSLNLLNFTVSTCVVSFVIGLVLWTAGLYSRTGPVDRQVEEERYRHRPPESFTRRTGPARVPG
jgi:hypothetical protein